LSINHHLADRAALSEIACSQQLCGIAAGQDNGGIERAVLNIDPYGFLYRTLALIAGLASIGFGVGPLLHGGDLFGTNWFGEPVFAPLAIVLGLVVVGFACSLLAHTTLPCDPFRR
jgi:hypothetical protein